MDILNSYKQGQISLEEAIKNLDLANTTNDKKESNQITKKNSMPKTTITQQMEEGQKYPQQKGPKKYLSKK